MTSDSSAGNADAHTHALRILGIAGLAGGVLASLATFARTHQSSPYHSQECNRLMTEVTEQSPSAWRNKAARTAGGRCLAFCNA
jgi:hypothetical protein